MKIYPVIAAILGEIIGCGILCSNGLNCANNNGIITINLATKETTIQQLYQSSENDLYLFRFQSLSSAPS